MDSQKLHKSVFLKLATEELNLDQGGVFVDCTFGRGGHSKVILEKLEASKKQHLLIAIDKDKEAINYGKEHFKDYLDKGVFILEHCSMANLATVLNKHKITDLSGVLMDLGLSSPQLDAHERGFSFNKNAKLDMRMNQNQAMDAKTFLEEVDEKKLVRILKLYGQEKFPGRIAASIKEAIASKQMNTTLDLVEAVKQALPFQDKNKHPATRVFQAIRIAVNDELQEIYLGLIAAVTSLKEMGRLVVISFHSIEDRLIKNFIKKKMDFKDFNLQELKKPIKAEGKEVSSNVRARSATLRVAMKLC